MIKMMGKTKNMRKLPYRTKQKQSSHRSRYTPPWVRIKSDCPHPRHRRISKLCSSHLHHTQNQNNNFTNNKMTLHPPTPPPLRDNIQVCLRNHQRSPLLDHNQKKWPHSKSPSTYSRFSPSPSSRTWLWKPIWSESTDPCLAYIHSFTFTSKVTRRTSWVPRRFRGPHTRPLSSPLTQKITKKTRHFTLAKQSVQL